MTDQDKKLSKEEIEEAVSDFYDKVAKGDIQAQVETDRLNASLGYSQEDLDFIPKEAQMGLGCGNPHEIAQAQEGEIVLDLGSGKGMDVFLTTRKVGDKGFVYGVDQNETMVERAKYIAEKRGFTNTEFRLGSIEDIPMEDNSLDLVISNCVINLSTNKEQVYREMFRVLKPGGRIGLSDIVLKNPLTEEMKNNPKLYGT